MEKLIKKVFVGRVWYTRIKGNRQKMRESLLDDLIEEAKSQGVDLDLSSFSIEEVYHKNRECEDKYELIASVDVLEPEIDPEEDE